jgi:hypothetical protein
MAGGVSREGGEQVVTIHQIMDDIRGGPRTTMSLQNRRKCKQNDELFFQDSLAITRRDETTLKRILRAHPLRKLRCIYILGMGFLIGTLTMKMNIITLFTSSVRRNAHVSLDELVEGGDSVNMMIRKAELVKRLQTLTNETQQDVMIDVFTPVPNPRSSLHYAITVATQGSLNKLPRLLDMTSRWLGPVSYSTLVASESDLDSLFQFWTDNPLIQEYVSIHVFMELPQLQRPENGRYPINQLRNLALHNVKTDYVFLNDVDFIPSDHAHDEIAALIQAFPLPTKTCWVLPAFERLKVAPTSTRSSIKYNIAAEDEVTDVALVPKTKSELLKAIHHDKVVTTFHPYVADGHRATDYEKWYTYNDNSSAAATMMYSIDYAKWFEPYVVCKVDDLHSFFPLFRGFGHNKNSFFIEGNIRNLTYYVLRRQFVVHMNHEGRRSRNQQQKSHIPPMLSAFTKYLENTYNVSTDGLYPQKLLTG